MRIFSWKIGFVSSEYCEAVVTSIVLKCQILFRASMVPNYEILQPEQNFHIFKVPDIAFLQSSQKL